MIDNFLEGDAMDFAPLIEVLKLEAQKVQIEISINCANFGLSSTSHGKRRIRNVFLISRENVLKIA